MLRMDLERFVTAQDHAGTYDRALAELRAGRKRTHWMWFVFPQVVGLGHSPISQTYALDGPREARAYLAHDVLGPRLDECCHALLDLADASAERMLGGVDAMKLRSSMTLFARADPSQEVFSRVLETFFDGEDERTVRLLE